MQSHNKFSKCPPLAPNAGMQVSAPLVDGIVNHVLLQSGPDLNQSHSQLVHVLHSFLVDAIFHHSPNLQYTGLRFGLFGGRRSGEMNAGVSRCSSLIGLRALCAGALSCWNISQGSVCHIGNWLFHRKSATDSRIFVTFSLTTHVHIWRTFIQQIECQKFKMVYGHHLKLLFHRILVEKLTMSGPLVIIYQSSKFRD